eukprot:39206-Pyramimonas_sp.AAC.1
MVGQCVGQRTPRGSMVGQWRANVWVNEHTAGQWRVNVWVNGGSMAGQCAGQWRVNGGSTADQRTHR